MLLKGSQVCLSSIERAVSELGIAERACKVRGQLPHAARIFRTLLACQLHCRYQPVAHAGGQPEEPLIDLSGTALSSAIANQATAFKAGVQRHRKSFLLPLALADQHEPARLINQEKPEIRQSFCRRFYERYAGLMSRWSWA
jgi:hypothetical protein